MWKNMRNRTIGINVRVSENEKKKLQKNAQKANLKLSSYLRKVGLQQKIYEIPDEELRKIYAGIVELKNEFNNYSQHDSPQMMIDFLNILSAQLNRSQSKQYLDEEDIKQKTIISIVAGYSHEKYEQLLPGCHHLTVMPNTPAHVLQGMTLFEKDNTLDEQELAYAKSLFESIGEVCVIDNYQMVAGGALTGCGPAFVYMFIEALADGAVLNGLPRDRAYQLASQMVLGAAQMVKETQLHPGILKDQVCSPGGITIKGVKALEENNFRNAVIEAINQSK